MQLQVPSENTFQKQRGAPVPIRTVAQGEEGILPPPGSFLEHLCAQIGFNLYSVSVSYQGANPIELNETSSEQTGLTLGIIVSA